MVKNIIQLIAVLGIIGLRATEIVLGTDGDVYLMLILGGIAIGTSSEEFMRALTEYFKK